MSDVLCLTDNRLRDLAKAIREAPIPESAHPSTLLGVEIRVCPYLPKTVKDKDGNDVELLGIMVGGAGFDPLDVDSMQFLTMNPEQP